MRSHPNHKTRLFFRGWSSQAAAWVCTLVWLGATPAWAQAVPNAAADESLTQKSRELFAEGNAYSAKGDFVRARAALKAAWGLMHHWGIAANLGEVELELGHHRDAAEMLAFALRNWPDKDWDKEKEAVQAAFDKARGRVGALKVEVDVEGATVYVGDREVGSAPLRHEVYVEPGKHVVSTRAARLGSAQSDVTLEPGGSESVSLRLAKPDEGKNGAAPPPHVEPENGESDGGNTKAIVVGAGAGLTLISVGVAVLYGSKASTAEDDAERLGAQLGANDCAVARPPSVCGQLADELDARNSANRVAGYAWVGAGVFAGATLATFLLWPDEEATVAPAVSKDGAFLSVGGRF